MKMLDGFKVKYSNFKALSAKEQRIVISDLLLNNALYIFMILACIYIQITNPVFLSVGSLNNIIQLSAANLPIALGIAGAIILTGTDLSAGRIVGLTAVISASLLQAFDYTAKMFDFSPLPLIVVFIITLIIGGLVGAFNGYCVSKFSLHPFIVTLASQLMVYGILLVYLNSNGNQGQALSGLSETYKNLVKGSFLASLNLGPSLVDATKSGNLLLQIWAVFVNMPNFVWFSFIIVGIIWVIWNKTSFGKNMFAVGSNAEAAKVSGVNVHLTIIMVFMLAGLTYGYTGFIESARIGSNSAATGFNYELDAISACVIGGVSFVGGTGKVSGVIAGVVLLRLIFVGLTVLSVDQNMQFLIKGAIILVAVAIDMRKYLVKK